MIYTLTRPEKKRVPVLISSPHSGTAFPDELKDRYYPEMIEAPEDTDWYIHQLYNFAGDLGITQISANYSRWVIDLNRSPESEPLYDDGRIITAICPTTSFSGMPIYIEGKEPTKDDIKGRLRKYFHPYHEAVQKELDSLKKEFGKCLLWDAHSIKQYVPLIREEIFPDLILGDNDQRTASQSLIMAAHEALSSGKLKVQHNDPFKGGYITRHFGKPGENQHALQLEMTKINYMDNAEAHYDIKRAEVIRKLLKNTFKALIAQLQA